MFSKLDSSPDYSISMNDITINDITILEKNPKWKLFLSISFPSQQTHKTDTPL